MPLSPEDKFKLGHYPKFLSQNFYLLPPPLSGVIVYARMRIRR
jgi:hypothetical protein